MKISPAHLLIFFTSYALIGDGFATDVLTYHNDNAHTGLNSLETNLTPWNVNSLSFGLIRNLPVDGAVYAQTLFVSNAQVFSDGQPQGFHNLLIVATEHDSVYVFDADSGTLYWQVSLLGLGEVPSDDRACTDLPGENGITSTPVIDRAMGSHGTIYVLAMSKTPDNVNYYERLHALDLATGLNVLTPVLIRASYPGNGPANIFNAAQQRGRAGLLLTNGTIYAEWASFCDYPPYSGWIIAYDERTLAQTVAFNTDPNGIPPSSDLPDGSGSGIWQAGQPASVDAAGNLYVATGNGPFDTNLTASGFPVTGDYGDTFLKLTPGLQITDYFTPDDQLNLAETDGDFGSSGTLLLDIADSSNVVHHLALTAGKDTNLYILNRDSLGKFNANTNSIYQELDGVLMPGGVWSSPAYFNGSVYYNPQLNSLLQFQFTASAMLDSVPISTTAIAFPYPGGVPTISSNGITNSIVWIEEPGTSQVVLHAYDATNLATELYSSAAVNFGLPTHFAPPTVCNGKVFVGTTNSVGVFGLLQPNSILSSKNIVTVPNPPDFDGDGKQDFLWRNTTTGQVAVWLMNGATAKATAVIGTTSLSWVMINTGDFNGDGTSDILWQLSNTSLYGVWFMNGTQVIGAQSFTLPSYGGQICCVADFDGDGLADLVSFNSDTGLVYFWKNTGSLQFAPQTSYSVGTAWLPLGMARLNGASSPPALIWRNANTGAVAAWFMSGFTLNSATTFGNPGNDVVLRGFGDFSGDGKADLLLFGTSVGLLGYWQSNGTQQPSPVPLAQMTGGWIPVGAENLDGSGNAEIIWRQISTAALAAWQVSGSTYGAYISPSFFAPTWQLQPQAVIP